MKSMIKNVSAILVLCLLMPIGVKAAGFTAGNVVVEQFGDGSAALSSAATPVFILEYLPSTAAQASPVQTITIPGTGSTRLTVAGNATSEGFLTRSTDRNILTLPGYDADAGTAGLAASTSTTVGREIGKLDVNGNFTRVATGSAMYSGGNIRSSISDGVNYWTAGSVGGVWYSAAGGAPIQITSGSGNFRVARIYNGNLYYSSSAAISVYSGLPAATATGTATGITSTSIYDFAINPAGTIAYVCDDGALTGTGGIEKWVLSGGVWTKKFTFGTANGLSNGCRSLAVDFSGANPVLYATDAATLTKLIKIIDTSALTDTSDAADQVTILATAAANTAFRGVALAPSANALAPSITLQPQDASLFVGVNATFTTAASGNAPLSYQWYYNTNTLLLNATNASLTVSNITTLSAGTYSATVTNNVGSVTTRYAVLTVSSTPVPPTITNQPASITVNAGDTAAFTVLAGGSPVLAYQWKSVVSGVTNILTNSSATTATLSLSGVTTAQAGQYFVTITNSFGNTNSTLATLTVTPPVALSIGQLRSMVDTNFAPTNTTTAYTITGTVTTWTNMTTSTTSSEFYMQDSSGGIVVFWTGAAPSTSLPAAGSLVQVTGPLGAFNGLLEIEPVLSNPLHNVTVLSTNNPLPKAQPLPFDPNVTGSLAAMKNFEGMYFVASNVMLNLVTPNFASGANDTITNNAFNILTATNSGATVSFTNQQGQTFILFVNAGTDIPNKSKYTTPVTIFGVLGYFSSAGYEFTPSRYADIISYNHVTNVLVNARKGDLATNSYSELVVRPGESLTTYVSIGDVAGGNVTITPVGSLPTGAGWSGITSGISATGVFSYTGSAADAGNNYPIQLSVSTTTGASYTQTINVYVPTPQEQQIAITEFLVSPTSNTNLSFYNPLKRATAVSGIATNDEYVEIVNQSTSDLSSEFFLDTGTASKPVFDSFGLFGTTLLASSSLVIYGGDGSPVDAPGLSTPVAASTGLGLSKSGGVLVLRNNSGYIIDRLAYAASDVSTNGSTSRFPTWTNSLVLQTYVSTNLVTPGAQYDGGSWATATKIPTGVAGVVITYVNGKAVLTFPANTSQASTLWNASDVAGPYNVIYGQPFPSGAGTFTNINAAAQQFYYISTQ